MTVSQIAAARGYLITFKPCGHVQHWPTAPETGTWLTHWDIPGGGCQTSRQVESVKPCPGCRDCWRQPALFTLEAA